ncbi:hypothetical protein H5410_008836 [Solanum commersonii]|uniref:Uncharacterized protein n=1 Tax=Solanum commersonii TaxID=4109 RepID=A0A9J6AHR9_SOLCO|nr:hypothetical protein H5410_008836 [Solanum commersonii]
MVSCSADSCARTLQTFVTRGSIRQHVASKIGVVRVHSKLTITEGLCTRLAKQRNETMHSYSNRSSSSTGQIDTVYAKRQAIGTDKVAHNQASDNICNKLMYGQVIQVTKG